MIDIQANLNEQAHPGEETAEIYRREARALYEAERSIDAAVKLLDAAYANDRDEAPNEVIVRDLLTAIALAPNEAWVASSARRLLVKRAQWQEALDLLACEMDLATSPDLKIACALEAAAIQWIVLNDIEEAVAWTLLALRIDPNHIGALYDALWLESARNAPLAAAEYAEKIAKILGAPEERAALFTYSANIRYAQNDDYGALGLYQAAVQADKSALYAQLGLASLNEKTGKMSEAAQNWLAAASRFDESSCAGEFYVRAGTLFYYTGDLGKASSAFDEALKRLPEDISLLMFALEVNERLGNTKRAIALEKRCIELAQTPQLKAELYVDMARIALKAGDDTEAAKALDAASELGAVEVFVHDWRCAISDRSKMPQDLAQILASRLAVEQDDRKREYLIWQQARALEISGNELEAAKIMHEQGSRLCFWRQCCVLEKTGNHEAHVRLLDQWLNTTRDEKLRDALKCHILMLLTERLEHPEIAYQYVRTPQKAGASLGAMFERLHLLVKLDQKEALLDALCQFADVSEDPEDAMMWRMEAATLAEMLGNHTMTLQILRKLHDEDPSFVPAIEMFHELALAQNEFAQVMVANEWRSALWPNMRNELFAENAWCAQLLGDSVKALEWHEAARQCTGYSSHAAVRDHARLLRQAGKVDEAVRILRTFVTGEPENVQTMLAKAEPIDNQQEHDISWDLVGALDNDTDDNDIIDIDIEDVTDKEAKNASRKISNVLDLNKILSQNRCDETILHIIIQSILDMESYCLGRPIGVAQSRAEVFYADPTFRHYIQYVIELLISGDRQTCFDEIMNATAKVQLPDEESKNLVLWLKAELIMGTTGDSNARIDLMLRSSLKQSYGMGLRAEILRRLRQKSDEEAANWLETYAGFTPDKWIAVEMLREASMRHLWIEHDFEGVRRTSLSTVRQSANDWRSLWELERLADLSEDFQALGVLRERMAQLEIDSRARLQTLKSALAPYVDEELDEHAVRVAQTCLKQDAHDFTALLTLAQLSEDAQNTTRLAYVADRLSEAAASSENRLSYGIWAANLWQEAGNDEQAFASLTALLATDPACVPAIAKAEQLLSGLKQWDKLSLVYVRAISALPEGKYQIELLKKQAALLANELDDLAGASIALSRILAQDAEDVEALTRQTELLSRQSRWSEAVETLELRIKCTSSLEDRRLANLRLADILIHEIADMDRARRILRRHLTQYDHDIDALRLLYDIACAEHDWLEARVTLDEICKQPSPIYIWAKLAYTRIAREAEWTNEVRVVYERAAITAVLGHRNDFDTLIADYKANGDLERLIRVAKYDLSKAQDAETVSQYRGCVAALYVANDQHREALSFLSGVISEGTQTDWAYLARAQALFSAGQLDSAAAEFRRTLTLNLNMDKAYEPFIEVLRQLGDEVALRAVRSFVEHKKGHRQVIERIIAGTPRGFFNIENIAIESHLIEAFQYLRLMTPYIYPVYERSMSVHPLDQKHWAVTRCRQLFGQNFEVKPLYFAKLDSANSCVRLTDPPTIVMSHTLLAEPNAQFDFWAAYAMHQAVTGGALIDAIDDDEADALFMALCQPEPETARAQALKRLIAKRLPRNDRKLFKDGVPFKAPDWSEFRNALSTRAACVAAVVSGSPACALQAFPKNESLQRFLISDTYVRLLKLYFT